MHVCGSPRANINIKMGDSCWHTEVKRQCKSGTAFPFGTKWYFAAIIKLRQSSLECIEHRENILVLGRKAYVVYVGFYCTYYTRPLH